MQSKELVCLLIAILYDKSHARGGGISSASQTASEGFLPWEGMAVKLTGALYIIADRKPKVQVELRLGIITKGLPLVPYFHKLGSNSCVPFPPK